MIVHELAIALDGLALARRVSSVTALVLPDGVVRCAATPDYCGCPVQATSGLYLLLNLMSAAPVRISLGTRSAAPRLMVVGSWRKAATTGPEENLERNLSGPRVAACQATLVATHN